MHHEFAFLRLPLFVLIAVGVTVSTSAGSIFEDDFDNGRIANSNDRTAFWATNDTVPEEVSETADGLLQLKVAYNEAFDAVGIFTREVESDFNFWEKPIVIKVRGLSFLRNGSEVTPFQTQHHLALSPTTGSLGRYQATTVAVRVTQSNQVTLSWKKNDAGPLAATIRANQQFNVAAGGRVRAYDLHLDGTSGTVVWKFAAYGDAAGAEALNTWSGNMGPGLKPYLWNRGGGSAMSVYCYKDSKARNFVCTDIDSIVVVRD